MDLLLDTTIQIDRITGTRERQSAVKEKLRGNELFCSTYVLGEYYSNIVNDLVTLYGLFLMDEDPAETMKRITERVFGRSQSRAIKLFANILSICDSDAEQIKDTFLLYMDLIQDEFYADVKEMLDTTQCARANRKIEYEEGVPFLPAVSCAKGNKVCEICSFWKDATAEAEKLVEVDGIDEKIKSIFKKARDSEQEYQGKNCWTLGDVIISVEALKGLQNPGVCSSNKKDFQPICDAIGIGLAVPDYSWKKHT